jgi:hypothetical protein
MITQNSKKKMGRYKQYLTFGVVTKEEEDSFRDGNKTRKKK